MQLCNGGGRAVRFVRLALKVVIQNDGGFVDLLLYSANSLELMEPDLLPFSPITPTGSYPERPLRGVNITVDCEKVWI